MKPKVSDRFWNGAERPKSKREFFNAVTTPAPTGEGATVATIRMYGPIDSWGGWWGISTKDVGQVLDALPESVEQIVLRINSPGGECFEAVAILNMLRAHKAKVLAVVDGLAASAASVIASGCDETVMSPGTQMMIHKPSVFSWGDAEDLRKDASILDTIEKSLVDIYAAKAGENDWAQLLADETWMTAAEAVALGLADREAVIPDAGEAATVGDENVIVIVTDDDADDATDHLPLRDWAAAHAIQTPVSTEPVDTKQQKEDLVSYEDLKAGLRERLGVTDADASDVTLLGALDIQLTEPPAAIITEAPEGTVLVDAEVFATLQTNAAAGLEAREQQISDRRDAIVSTALAEGRIAAASRQSWRDQLDKDEEGAAALLATLPKNTAVPVTEIGRSDDIDSSESLAKAAGWTAENKEEVA
ncbi:MAG: head maturation protease, ClpP-related [Pseudolysinimonas sp.]